MAIKLADTLAPMSDFPAAMAEHIGFSDGATLQEKFDNKELGGGDNSLTITQEEYNNLSIAEQLDGLYYTYDTKRIYKNGVQYGGNKAITLSSQEEYNQREADGEIEPDVDYVIEETEQNVNAIFGYVPIGVVFPYCATTPPANYLICDGSLYEKTAYPELYAIIGNTFGGDNAIFAVPNLTDRFIQGGTNVGEYIEAGLPNITGSFIPWGYKNNLSPSGAFSQSKDNVSSFDIQGNTSGSQINFDASKSNAIYGNSDTVQPPSVVLLYIIKCK